MTENKSNDLSDDLQTPEVPLKKRKDSRLYNSASRSWHIENSNSGNPLKKRFFRSSLPNDGNKLLPNPSVQKKTYFSSTDEEKNISVNPDSTYNENETSLKENKFILHSADKDSYVSYQIPKPTEKVEVDLDAFMKGVFERNKVNNEHKLMMVHNVNSQYGIPSEAKDLTFKKESPVNSPSNLGIEEFSSKNHSLNSFPFHRNPFSHLKYELPKPTFAPCYSQNNSENLTEAVNLMTQVCNVPDLSKKLVINENSYNKRLKMEECKLLPETVKTAIKCEEQSYNTHFPEGNVSGNSLKPMFDAGSPPVSLQDKVFASSLLSNYVDYFCNSEINAVPSQSSPHKTESFLSQESQMPSSGVLEQTLLLLQQSADNAVSFSKDDTYNCLMSSNLSNPENELTSQGKNEQKFLSGPSSSLDDIYIQSNPLKSPLNFSLLLKATVPHHDRVSEVRKQSEKFGIGGNNSLENTDYVQLSPSKSPIDFSLLSKNNENAAPQRDATSRILNNSASSSHVIPDNGHAQTLKSPLNFSILLRNNEDIVPSQYERNHNATTSSENLFCESSPLDVRFFKCLDNIRGSEGNFLQMSGLKDKKHTENKTEMFFKRVDNTVAESEDKQLMKYDIAKDKEDSLTEGKTIKQKMLVNNENEEQQILINEGGRESEGKLKYFPSNDFTRSLEESRKEGESIESCKEQLRNSVQGTSLIENILKQKTLLNNENKFQRDVPYVCDEESKVKTEFLPSYSMLTESGKDDKLKNALIEVCEEELKNSFKKTSPIEGEVVRLSETPVNNKQEKQFPRISSCNPQDTVIDLCSNNDKQTNDDGNDNEGDDDIKVIEVFRNRNHTDLNKSPVHPTSSKTSIINEFESFESLLYSIASTSSYPSLPLYMTNPRTVQKKSTEPLPSSSNIASGSHQADKNKRKKNKNYWDIDLLSSNDEYLSISSPDSVISISSSSPSSSPLRDHNQPSERTIEEEIFGSLIKAMDGNSKERKHLSILRRTGRSKEIPVLTVPEDDDSDEDFKRKKQKVPGKVKKACAQSTSGCNQGRTELECAICLENMSSKRGTSATTCGHVYCTPCIEEVIEKKGECPTCRKALDSTKVHKLFLFA